MAIRRNTGGGANSGGKNLASAPTVSIVTTASFSGGFSSSGSGTYTTPLGCRYIRVREVGGGGGGGGGSAGGFGGTGGGAGGYIDVIISNPQSSYSFQIGAGGAGAAFSPGAYGGSGGATTFGTGLLTAGGGGGGIPGTADNSTPAGGTSTATGLRGIIASGNPGELSGGVTGAWANGGNGGSSFFGGAGGGGWVNSQGYSATADSGSGGGGSGGGNTGYKGGGNGASGQIIVEEFY